MANNGAAVIPRQSSGSLVAAPAGYLEIIANNDTGKLASVDESGVVTPYGATSDALFTLSAGRNAIATNIYLRGLNGVPTNISGYIMPFNATIVAISGATAGAESWTAEIRKNNSVTVIASLEISSAAKAKDATLNVDVDADDEIQFFCNGTDIDTPMVTIWLKRR